jgi:hypothetical protein
MSWSLSEQPSQSSKSKSIDQPQVQSVQKGRCEPTRWFSGSAYQAGRTARDLAPARQTLIDEDAGQLVADRVGGPAVALRDILRCGAILVAFGLEADIKLRG